ncbi:hydroxymethylglutaryl-CoA lyase [Tunicatimonas pelagia]|uniref:hydroxymethylglutaryl-CoA lyase n=1 Tax=Tunicatimonas pelagia TaxID=931531 RepID=UPI0026662EF1|nr:hydroxymethylglutaryl-CoA lyase [Tunicatimonas pelagia]WKN42011.1 hydroxymethylglutaryl-CoA lyase [Tunicatimonas pelagia]
MIKITECPRDAMQGIEMFIPTEDKVRYINAILQVGFDTVDFGSFVSPKAIPQMRDTAEVLTQLDLTNTDSKLLAIIGNQRGAADAVQFDEITYLGFPFSISPTFLQRNINSTVEKSFDLVKALLETCNQHNKQLVTYVSMAFGNPYGDEWNIELLLHWIDQLHLAGVRHITLADTVGIGEATHIGTALAIAIPAYQEISFGLHLHTKSTDWREKIDAAYQSGCLHYDGVLSGLGGCPMAGPDLVGNIHTRHLLNYFKEKRELEGINKNSFRQAEQVAAEIIS